MDTEDAPQCYDPPFRVPSKTQIAGPSLISKITFLYDLVKDAQCYFRGDNGSPCWFPQIVYCYGSAWQPIFNQYQKMGVQFHEGLLDNMEALFPPETRDDHGRSHARKQKLVSSDQTVDERNASLGSLCHFPLAEPFPFAQGASWSKSQLYHCTVLFRNGQSLESRD